MKVKVNKDICIGCGACTVIANNIFEIGDDGLAETISPFVDEELKVKEIADVDTDNVVDAAESCPVGAIDIEQ